MEKETKKSLSVQVNEQMYQQLLDLAAEYGANIATVIRMIVVDYLKRYKKFGTVMDRKEEE